MKNPDDMTAEELLKRIRSLEGKVSDLRFQLALSKAHGEQVDAYADAAWKETRRCWDLLTLRAKMQDDRALPDK